MDIDAYAKWTKELWVGPKEHVSDVELDARNLAICTLGLSGETGEVVEHVKKLLRDGTELGDDFKKEMGDILYYWARLCHAFDIKPSEIIDLNVKKLESRKARGVQRGSGDNR